MNDADCPVHGRRTPMPDDIAEFPLAKECYCTTCLANMIEVRPDRGLLLDSRTPIDRRGLLVCPRCGEEWIEGRPPRRPCAVCLGEKE